MFGSLNIVTHRRSIEPSARRLESSSANRSMFLIANANVLPCHVTLISAFARSASRTVLTNESSRSWFSQADVLKKIRTS